jgi:hypothetical protein
MGVNECTNGVCNYTETARSYIIGQTAAAHEIADELETRGGCEGGGAVSGYGAGYGAEEEVVDRYKV